MFSFVVKYLGFLKYVPGLALLFDSWLKLRTLITNPYILDHIDEIEAEVLKWKNTCVDFHKYGGLQFNYNTKEMGHIHSNGLVDILLSREIKKQLLTEGHIKNHHLFKNSGWISFYVHTPADTVYAIRLLKLAYDRQYQRHLLSPGSNHQTSLPAVVAVLA
jgi:hypothetical protein